MGGPSKDKIDELYKLFGFKKEKNEWVYHDKKGKRFIGEKAINAARQDIQKGNKSSALEKFDKAADVLRKELKKDKEAQPLSATSKIQKKLKPETPKVDKKSEDTKKNVSIGNHIYRTQFTAAKSITAIQDSVKEQLKKAREHMKSNFNPSAFKRRTR